jgi:tRNA threonylcarbamoyladenosine biosynthesis protein TsaE
MIHIASDEAMKEFGRMIGAQLSGGEILELVGDVGAGKTTFVKGLARGLKIDDDIQSPSFTINRTYDARDGLRLSHYDFYRLHDPGIMADELREVTDSSDTITVIEWADIVTNVLPDDRLTISITADGEESRAIELHAAGAKANMLQGLIS